MKLSKQEACCFFRLGLATALIDRQSLVEWADRTLLTSQRIEPEIIELALCGRLPYSQIIWQLNHYQVGAEIEQPLKLLLALAGEQLDEHPEQAAEILQSLCLLNAEAYLPNEIRRSLQSMQKGWLAQNRPRTLPPGLNKKLVRLLKPYQVFCEPLAILLSGQIAE